MSDPEDAGSLWVGSALGPGDRYHVRLELGRLAWTLNRQQAERYARAWLRAAQLAAHDAAVLAQLTALGVEQEPAAVFVATELRTARPALDQVATRPLRLQPIVSAATGEPIVQVHPDGERDFQLEATAATSHAVHTLEVAAVTDLDDAYRWALVDALDMEDVRARAAVDDLARFRRTAAG
jgi:hypothetical protein